MIFTFRISPEGMIFVKENKDNHSSNVGYDENQSTVWLKLLVKEKSTIKEFRSTIKSQGLVIGQKDSTPISLDPSCIIEYPYELKELL